VAAEVAHAIDAVASGPVLVIGSPPPGGRDLDLLASPNDYTTIQDWLMDAGFVSWRQTWARFDDPGPYAVELTTTQRWRTRQHDASSLFADAEPLPGFRNLVLPSPATVLLLAARGTVTRRGGMTESVRRRVFSALERSPDAWDVAEKRARDLGMLGAVQLLRIAYETPRPLPAGARAAGLSRVVLSDGPLGAKARILLGARPRRIRPAVISFSGLDGSGKSTQVSQLRDSLSQLGVTSELQWAGFKTASKLRGALPILDRAPAVEAHRPPSQPDKLMPAAFVESPAGRHAWVFVVVGFNLAHLWRLVLRRRPGSKVLIFDRFSPDSMVKLDLHFNRTRQIDIRWQRRLFTLLSPKPDLGFLVEVTSSVAYSRRQDQTPDELANMAELYEEQVERFRLHRLDGTAPPKTLGERIAVAAWKGLR
jgi:thymidylate kinase